MLIIVTTNQAVVNWSNTQSSQAKKWGKTKLIMTECKREANILLNIALSELAPGEPLCISGEGDPITLGLNDHWYWSPSDLALRLGALPADHTGDIYIDIAHPEVCRFHSNLALTLRAMHLLGGARIFGNSIPVGLIHRYAHPKFLMNNHELNSKAVTTKPLDHGTRSNIIDIHNYTQLTG